MKKIFALLMAGLLAVSVCACSDKDKDKDKDVSGLESSAVSNESKITVDSGENSKPETVDEVEVLVVTGDGVNIRSSTDTDTDPIAVADKDEAFKLIKKNAAEGWHEIQYDGNSAYVSAEFSQIKTVTADAAKTMIGEDAKDSDEDDDTSDEDENSVGKEDDKLKAEDIRENEDGEAR